MPGGHFQTTLKRRATLKGVGVHGGQDASITFHPAEIDTGVVFLRSDDALEREIPASFRHVSATDLCTAIGVGESSVATIEHVMATLLALGVDNVQVEVDGPEVPIMDGSAGPFVEAIEQAGIVRLSAARRHIKVLRPVFVQTGECHAEFKPHDRFRVEVAIDFASALIGRQSFAADIDAGVFCRELARARTFGFMSDVEALWQRGFALGASLENAVVIGDDRIVNPEGLRFVDEFARHKALDAVGDLALAGAPILGHYRSFRGGHKLNVMAIEALLADEDAWTWAEPPARRDAGHADLHAGVGVPAYGPDAS